jgi:hypothetical protein
MNLPDARLGPPSGAFVPADWRGTTRVDVATRQVIGVSFNTAGEPVRLLLSTDSARRVAESILHELQVDYERGTNSQSATSTGAPSVDVSRPEDGVNV